MAKTEAKKGDTKKTKAKKGESKVSVALVVRMADRMFKLGPTMRENMAARARKRIDAGYGGKNDAAIVRAAGGK